MGQFKEMAIDGSFDLIEQHTELWKQYFADQATGHHLTDIGMAYDIVRFSYETDEMLRQRILATIRSSTVAQEEYPREFDVEEAVSYAIDGYAKAPGNLNFVPIDIHIGNVEVECQHEKAHYEGLRETFDYCKKCDKRL